MSDSDLELYGIVGKMLREFRENNELSLETVAEYLGIAPKSVQRYECGERKIKIGTIKKLCDFYKISYDAFIIEAKLRFGKNVYVSNIHNVQAPKIMQYYEQLNDSGKGVATDRVKELTEIPRYTKEEMPDHLKPRAAHNDDQSEDQLAKMKKDMAKLKRPE